MGVLAARNPLFGVYSRAPGFLETTINEAPKDWDWSHMGTVIDLLEHGEVSKNQGP